MGKMFQWGYRWYHLEDSVEAEVPNIIKVFGWRACHNILPT